MRYVKQFEEIDKDDVALAGGKGAQLGEMFQAGFPVPPGFIVTVEAYEAIFRDRHLREAVAELLTDLDPNDSARLAQVAVAIQKLIKNQGLPAVVSQEIEDAYRALGDGLVAVRSSATAEDLPTASFAGEHSTFLNIKGKEAVGRAILACLASLFEPRAIFYRATRGFDHFKVKIAVVVQKMVQSERSGVAFSCDPASGDPDRITIEAGIGLGEAIVSGAITPDRYLVSKSSGEIIGREIHEQAFAIVRSGSRTVHRKLPAKAARAQKLTDSEVLRLADLVKRVEAHYAEPQDIEWGIEGGTLYLLQARPVTTLKKRDETAAAPAPGRGEVLLRGSPASFGVGIGPCTIIHSAAEISKVKPGDVLVTEMTNPAFVPAMRRAVAIVTDTGGVTSHAAIVSRELGIPCVVGTGHATSVLKQGLLVTVDGARGLVFKGKVVGSEAKRFQAQPPSAEIPLTGTKIYVNLSEPELAPTIAAEPVDGVGLLRAEFMIAGIGEHPKAALKAGRGGRFSAQLAEGIATIARAFAPRPVVYRSSDFKTNEYRGLRGGEREEPEEENPMLGFRGALRYISEPEVFALELEALRLVRERDRLKNLWLMIPFVRTPEELAKVTELLEEAGLFRSPDFKLWMMVEVPSNVIRLPDFVAVGIDGISIGSNDLTQLILGVDRDAAHLREAFDERDPAVLEAIRQVIETARRCGISSSVCGQAPSVWPEFVEAIVAAGITSISVNPDRIFETRKLVASIERKVLLDRVCEMELGLPPTPNR